MRAIPIIVLAACGGTVATPGAAPSEPYAPANQPGVAEAAPIDPIAALTPTEAGNVSWLVPGRAQLEVGSAPIEAPLGSKPVEVEILEQHGNLVRVAVRAEHARFSLWTERARLMALVRRDQRVSQFAGGEMMGEMQVVLRAGAAVKKLAHKKDWTQVRYFGALEVSGWMPDSALGDTGPHRDPRGRNSSGQRTLMVTPGAVIRTEPKWASRELAVMATSFLDRVKQLDQAWVEVAYADGDVMLRGYYSQRDPPGALHRPQPDPEAMPVLIAPNATVTSGTCLYARRGGDPIGYVVADREVDLQDSGNGWWTLAIDTPWGAISFAALGPTRADLIACAPTGTVPAPAGAASPSVP